MGIRETLNQNPAITTAATGGIILIALIFIIYQMVGGGGPRIQTTAYYTVDDGKTWFPDSIERIPPFDRGGQEAVRAHVFSCRGGRDAFVAYLEKYTPEAQKRLEAARANPEASDPGIMETVYMTGVLVKKPGQGDWVNSMDPRAQEVTAITCPDGTTNNLEPVLP
jgi:hypothetical protein